MPNRVNRSLKQEYGEFFKGVTSVVAIGYPGMNVQQTDQLRAAMRKSGFDMVFVRNNIAVKTSDTLNLGSLEEILVNQSAVCKGTDIVSVARFLVDFQKKEEKILLHGALVDGAIVKGEAAVKRLAKTPTLVELKSIISGQILSAGSRLSGALLAMGGKVASQIQKKAEPKEETA